MVRRAGPLYLLAFVLRAQHAVAVLQAAQLTLQLPRSCLLQAWTNTQMLQPPAKLRAAQALHRHCEDRTSTANILTKSNRMQAVATGAPCKVVWPCVAPYSIALLAKVLLTCPAWVTYLPATPAPPHRSSWPLCPPMLALSVSSRPCPMDCILSIEQDGVHLAGPQPLDCILPIHPCMHASPLVSAWPWANARPAALRTGPATHVGSTGWTVIRSTALSQRACSTRL